MHLPLDIWLKILSEWRKARCAAILNRIQNMYRNKYIFTGHFRVLLVSYVSLHERDLARASTGVNRRPPNTAYCFWGAGAAATQRAASFCALSCPRSVTPRPEEPSGPATGRPPHRGCSACKVRGKKAALPKLLCPVYHLMIRLGDLSFLFWTSNAGLGENR